MNTADISKLHSRYLDRLSKYYHTLRYLKWQQVVYRIYYRFFKLRLPTALIVTQLQPGKIVNYPLWGETRYLLDGSFEFMRIRDTLSWTDIVHPKIWSYNLHYFDNLTENCLYSDSLVERWIKGNSPFTGIGWQPYPLSLRIVNWIKYFSTKPQLEPGWLDSLALQAYALSKQIEYHILANHLFVNGKALVFVGAFLQGDSAKNWLKTGLKILDKEVEEQFLQDGAHYELSPMYQSIMIWDICDLLLLTKNTQLEELNQRVYKWKEVLLRGIEWLYGLRHSDGGIAFFNDATLGIAPKLSAIISYAESLGVFFKPPESSQNLALQQWPESGFASIDAGMACKVIINFSNIRASYQPGHKHADTLSYELSLFGNRVLVNSGISQYGIGAAREYQRSTSAHNTVEVDGKNSSEVWAGFRVARRAVATLEEFTVDETVVQLCCSHDGYSAASNKNIHKRTWVASTDELVVLDELSGTFTTAVSRLFIHPEVLCVSHGNEIELRLPNGREARLIIAGAQNVTLEESFWFPEFGAAIPNKCIAAEFLQSSITTTLRW